MGRETVGQRKTRKEQEVANGTSRKTPDLSRRSSIRSSNSSGSTFGHKRPSLFNIFGSTRKDTPSRVGYRTQTPTQSVAEPVNNSRRLSSYTADSDSSGHELPGMTTRFPKNGFFGRSPPYYSEGELSAPSEASESVFSGWTGKSAVTESTWDSGAESVTSSAKLGQPLSQNSFVTQSTSVKVSSRDRVKVAEQTATIVQISASGKGPNLMKESTGKVPPSSPFGFPLPVTALPKTPPKDTLRNEQVSQLSDLPIAKRSLALYTWKPPEIWEGDDNSPRLVQRCSSTQLRPIKERRHKVPTSEIAHLQRSIRRMEAASSKIVLERLKEQWVEVADASVYRELELEKQLWMLTALRTLENKSHSDELVMSAPSRPRKVLSLRSPPLHKSTFPKIIPKYTPPSRSGPNVPTSLRIEPFLRDPRLFNPLSPTRIFNPVCPERVPSDSHHSDKSPSPCRHGSTIIFNKPGQQPYNSESRQ